MIYGRSVFNIKTRLEGIRFAELAIFHQEGPFAVLVGIGPEPGACFPAPRTLVFHAEVVEPLFGMNDLEGIQRLGGGTSTIGCALSAATFLLARLGHSWPNPAF